MQHWILTTQILLSCIFSWNILPTHSQQRCPDQPCVFGDFCFAGTIVICIVCHYACNGCSGPGPDECLECATGYGKVAGWCTLSSPGPVSILHLAPMATSIMVTFQSPTTFAGDILMRYETVYSNTPTFASAMTLTYNSTLTSPYEIKILNSNTTYYIKMRAYTLSKTGPFGNTASARTLERLQTIVNVPSLTNSTCIAIAWGASNITGIIKEYLITFTGEFENTSAGQTDRVVGNITQYVRCGLRPNTRYAITVTTQLSDGSESTFTGVLYTEQNLLPQPPPPVLINVTATSATISLEPVAPSDGYTVVMYQINLNTSQLSESNRSVGTGTGFTGIQEVPGYIIALLPPNITNPYIFVIGDGQVYLGYWNAPLLPGLEYEVFYTVIITSRNEVTKYSYTKMTSNIITSLMINSTLIVTTTLRTQTSPGGNTTSTEPVDTQPTSILTPFSINATTTKTSLGSVAFSVGPTNPGLSTTSPDPNAVQPNLTTTVSNQSTTTNSTTGSAWTNGESSLNGLWIGLGIAIPLLVIIVTVSLVYSCYKKRPLKKSKQTDRDTDVECDDDESDIEPSEGLYWNGNSTFTDSRYIMAGRECPEYDPQSFWSPLIGPEKKRKIREYNRYNLRTQNETDLHQNKNSKISFKNEFDSLSRNSFPASILDAQKHSKTTVIPPDQFYSHFQVKLSPLKQNHYITTQGTIDISNLEKLCDVVFQKSIKTVVLMCKVDEIIKMKKSHHLSNKGKMVNGDLELLQKSKYAHFNVWIVRVKRKEATSESQNCTVRVYEFTSWPTHGVPDDPIPFLDMRYKIRKDHGNDPSPILVQSIKDDGRVGVFTAVDSLIDQHTEKGLQNGISVYDIVQRMSTRPLFLVRTYKQYAFIYESIFEEFHADKVKKPEKKPVNKQTGKRVLHEQFRCLRLYTRGPDLVPLPSFMKQNTFLNAVFVDGYRKRKQFILTETPRHGTIDHFWSVVCENNVQAIVTIDTHEHDNDYVDYWSQGNPQIQKSPFLIEKRTSNQQHGVIVRIFNIPEKLSEKSQTGIVRQFHFKNWASKSSQLPTSKKVALDLVFLVLKYQTLKNLQTIMVHCKNGITHSGLFVALWLLSEKIMEEKEVDVYQTIKHLMRQHPQFIDSYHQFRYCYKCLPGLKKRVRALGNSKGRHARILPE